MHTLTINHFLKSTMKSIAKLSAEELKELRHYAFQTTNKTIQKRCQCILYSYYGIDTKDITACCNIDRRSIYNWIERWEAGGIEALKDKPGRGLKPRLNVACQEQVERIRQAILLHPHSLHEALNHVNASLAQPISRDTLRRFVKRLQMTARP